MTPQEYLSELERRLDHDDPRGAFVLWCDSRDQRLERGLSAIERRRLRGTLHVVLQMAAERGWDHDETVGSTSSLRKI
jgi:hypothetical protein